MIEYSNNYAKIENGDFIRLSFDQNGNPRKFLIIQTPESKRFVSYIAMNRDLDLVIEAIEELQKVTRPIIQQSLLFFSIVTYAKCFISNNGSRSSLNDDVFKKATDEIKEEHQRIMNLRNGYVAHAGSDYDKGIVIGTLVEFGNMVIGIDVNTQLLHVVNMPPKLNDFKKLCKFIKEQIQIKIKKASEQVYNYASNLEGISLKKTLVIPNKEDMYKMVEINDNTLSGFMECNFEPVKTSN